jgi:hypothetical protein
MADDLWSKRPNDRSFPSNYGEAKKKPANEEVFVGGGWRTPQAVGALRCGERMRMAVFNIRHNFKIKLMMRLVLHVLS